jgi:hypothetical protein
LIETKFVGRHMKMRVLLGLLAAVALACAVGACAAIAGLTSYTAGDCQNSACDASVHPNHPDVVDSVDAPTVGDDTGPHPGDDGGLDAGCAAGFLICSSSCTDPSSAANCGACRNACGGDAALCATSDSGTYGCVGACPANAPTDCSGTCSDTTSDSENCGTCGTACPEGQICSDARCMPASGPGDAGVDSGIACPDGGCPSSTPTGFSCPTIGHCNGTMSECTDPGGCFCNNDNQCKSNKCVKVTRENDVSCGSNCTGSGGRDGFNCELASPGIPSLGTGGTYACPAMGGYNKSTLSCDSTHTNCYCTADSQCPSGKCVPSSNNNNCSGCTGTGTPDYQGCQATIVIGLCPIYIGCPVNTLCQYPTCYCFADVACASGHCIASSHNNNCASPAGPCTGMGADDGHGCVPAPSSVACVGTGGTMCTTTLTPAPVLNSAKTACLCVADSDCSSGKCVNKDSQCTVAGMCTGSGTADSEDCETAVSVANAWSCSIGNCDSVSSPTGLCTAAGIPCWCTSDSQCPSSTQCASWSGCASGACMGSGGPSNPFHCVP